MTYLPKVWAQLLKEFQEVDCPLVFTPISSESSQSLLNKWKDLLLQDLRNWDL
jgi:hypothetical protein